MPAIELGPVFDADTWLNQSLGTMPLASFTWPHYASSV